MEKLRAPHCSTYSFNYISSPFTIAHVAQVEKRKVWIEVDEASKAISRSIELFEDCMGSKASRIKTIATASSRALAKKCKSKLERHAIGVEPKPKGGVLLW